MVDFEMLGALIGSAWRDENQERADFWYYVQGISRAIGNQTGFNKHPEFMESLTRTMRRECYACGTSSKVGRGVGGVYSCEPCMWGIRS